LRKQIVWIALVVVLAALSADSVRADAIGTATFTITNIVGGAYAGDTFTGTLTYDATAAQTTFTPLLSFTTNLPSWAGANLSDPGVAQAVFNDTGGVDLFYSPGPAGNTNAFTVYNGAAFAGTFVYGTTEFAAGGQFLDAGTGTFTITSESVPEIDPKNGMAPFALLVGAVLIIRGRRKIPTPIA